jgi:putative transcriptional regulator
VVGARVRELRLEAELTQQELADRIGSHRPIIGRIERGVHVVTLEVCVRVAAALELDLGTLLACLDEGPS